jgi:hypothetical protein
LSKFFHRISFNEGVEHTGFPEEISELVGHGVEEVDLLEGDDTYFFAIPCDLFIEGFNLRNEYLQTIFVFESFV